jgi:hypothetical protein
MAGRRRPVKQEIRTWAATQAAEKERVERSKLKQRLTRQDFLDNILAHGMDMINRNKNKLSKRLKLGRAVSNYHVILQKEYQRKTDRFSKERLAALKNNDEEAYLKLIDEAKDTRITHLLRQTDVYLESLAKAVIAQQNEFRQFAPTDLTVRPGGNIIRPNDTITSASYNHNQSFLNNARATLSDNRIQSVNGVIETASNGDTARLVDNSMKISNLLISDTVPATISEKNAEHIPGRSNITTSSDVTNHSNDNIANEAYNSNSSVPVEDEDNIIQTTVWINLVILINWVDIFDKLLKI